KDEYTYGVNSDQTQYQIAAVLENNTVAQINTIANTTYADLGVGAKVNGNYPGYVKYSTGTSTYIANIPSLLWNNSGSVDLLNNSTKYVVNKKTNLPYKLNSTSDIGTKDANTIIQEITGTGVATLTGVNITNITSSNIGTTFTGAILASFGGDISKLTTNVIGGAVASVPTIVTPKVGEQTNPGLSCLDILSKGGNIGNGIYWIKPDTNPTFQVYCDMTTDGGGWTLIAKTFANTNDALTGSVGNVYDYNSSTFTKLSDLNINSILSTNSGQRYFMGTGISLTTYWKVVDNTFIWDSLGNTNNGTTAATAKTYISKTGITGTYYASYRPVYPSGYYGAGVHYWGYRNGTSAGYAGTNAIRTAGCPGYLTYQGNNLLGSGNCYSTTGGPVIWYLK
ncbi:MAG: fibrinogen-like YCDxxxxGGGW domain-containing protein, partial [Candidatus Gracilibacteria bacterium]|nr:fibrinogen-like YCDxxxxGGGW domain-containing protein [Candidatus Gracilibacteria bacterium]